MRLELDHIAVVASHLDDGVSAVETALGVSLAPGGKHPLMATHNRLLGLGPGLYLEVIAPDPDAPAPEHPRWFGLDDFAGPPHLTHWICRTPSLDATLAASPDGAGRATDLQRGDYSWRMAIPASGHLPLDDAFPGLIEWQGPAHPAERLPDLGCRLRRLTISTPHAGELARWVQLADPRVEIVWAAATVLTAEIATPRGTWLLT